MARYVVHVRTHLTPEEAFAFMADLTNFERWDPGVVSAKQVDGDGPGLGAAFDVEVKAVPKPITLRYHTTTFEPSTTMVARAESKMLTSLDTIEIHHDPAGSVVTYDAELTLNGALGIADPLLALAFDRIGDRAADGLIQILDGEKVEEPSWA